MESEFDRTQRMIDELEESRGYRYIQARDLHKSSIYIFAENGRILIEALKSFKGYFAFPGLDEREETNRQHREILRHFQNFVASALALVDASRNWTAALRMSFPDFCAEYDARRAVEFTGSVNHLFVQDLRNYMLHYRLPRSASQGSFTLKFSLKDGEQNNETNWAIVFDLEGLREWDGWRAEPKAYLAACTDDIDLLTIVEPYHQQVITFYAWFHRRIEELHADDVAESAKRHVELHAPTTFRLKTGNPPPEKPS